ncbi:hypothetical protein DWX97_03765 [Bacteroides cellulosilyticus]|uniref:Uncharacterized protein n=1 Tax=Bacteroides cellulosilyticus TaxID=246787 RepID=A0A412IM73_9BACE|nr:hypothetical protein DWX97_03765 [Bacteroides cellulosilyticus]
MDANKHKVVWKKNSSRYLEGVKVQIGSMQLEIDTLSKRRTSGIVRIIWKSLARLILPRKPYTAVHIPAKFHHQQGGEKPEK